jgi:putative transposase
LDGKGRCLDTVFIGRLWRSLKHECISLHAWETGSQAKAGIGSWIAFYYHHRPQSSRGATPPAMFYRRIINPTQPDQQAQKVA